MDARARRELTALRRASQRIAGSTFTTAGEVARWMLGIQAQDFPGAKWSIGLRLPGSTDAGIEAALAAGELVRSWPMRGTLHFVAPEDLQWMLNLTRARNATAPAKRRADLGLTRADEDRVGEVARAALAGGRALRRDDLLAAFEEAGIATTGQRGYHLLFLLAQESIIVFGPVDGKQQTFVLFEEWITHSRQLDGEEALAEFAGRYFRSHGPATVRDFAWWSSLTLRDARAGIALADLEARDMDGVTHYLAPGLEPAREAVAALPGFDEYLLGYQDRSGPLSAEYSDRIVPGGNGIFLPTLVVDGQVVGTWRRTERSAKTVVDLVPFAELDTSARTSLESAFVRYSEFIAKPVEVR